MRYLTKEWYYTMNDSGLGVCLEIDERAAMYSEEVYQTLRSEKLVRWLVDREEVCEVLEEPFDPEGEARSFDEFCTRELERYRIRTPAHILSKVVDLRLLALGFCTPEVWQDFEDFRRDCEKRTIETMEIARKEQEAAGLSKLWTGDYSLHDSRVASFIRDREDLVLEFEREDTDWPEIKAIRFHEARIRLQEKPLENAWWQYDEICRTDRGFEIHVLLWDTAPFAFTVECENMELVWTESRSKH